MKVAHLPQEAPGATKEACRCARVEVSSSLLPPPLAVADDDLGDILGDIVNTSGVVGANPLQDKFQEGSPAHRMSDVPGRTCRVGKGTPLDLEVIRYPEDGMGPCMGPGSASHPQTGAAPAWGCAFGLALGSCNVFLFLAWVRALVC